MSETIKDMVTPPEAVEAIEEEEESQTQAEFAALYADAKEGTDRLTRLAGMARSEGRADVADLYDEVRGTVMGLLTDLVAATGGALTSIEDQLPDEEERSQLLPEDAEKYLALFEQFTKLLGELQKDVPSGSAGDAQRAIFQALGRMVDGLADFTREITIGGEADDDDDDDDEEEEIETPESE